LTKTFFWLSNTVAIVVQTEMHHVKKPLSRLLLLIILICGFFLFISTNLCSAQASADANELPTPSVPEITVKFVDASYAVTTTNLYTGLDETVQISNKSIEITINNQPFDYPNHQLYYDVRIKPHFGENWTDIHKSTPQSNSSNTLIIFYVVPTDYYGKTGYDISRDPSGYHDVLVHIPDDSQLDFQVQALVGHIAQRWVSDSPFYPNIGRGYYEDYVEVDTTSGWSETQTITINALSPVDQLNIILIGALILIPIVAGLGLLIYLKKRK